jgi:hypothetical protein
VVRIVGASFFSFAHKRETLTTTGSYTSLPGFLERSRRGAICSSRIGISRCSLPPPPAARPTPPAYLQREAGRMTISRVVVEELPTVSVAVIMTTTD